LKSILISNRFPKGDAMHQVRIKVQAIQL